MENYPHTDLSDMVQLAAHGVPRHEIEIVARAYGDIHSFSGHTQGGGSSIGGVTVPAVSSPLLFQPFSFLPVAEIKLNIRMAHTDKPMFLVLGIAAGRVRDLFCRIEEQYTRLFKEVIAVTFVTNDKGSVIDEDHALERACRGGDCLDAFRSPLSTARAKKNENRAQEGHGRDDMTRDKRQKRVDPNAPKRPTNAFMRYATSRRNEIPDHQPKGTDFMRQLGQEWASLSKLEKEPFLTESMADLAKYATAKTEYDSSLPVVGPQRSEQPKRLIKRLLEKLDIDVQDRDEAKLGQLLVVFNQERGSRRTKGWMVKQLNQIVEKQTQAQPVETTAKT